MNNYFKKSHFYKSKHVVSSDVLKKLDLHIATLNPIRHALGCPIFISKKSGYRPVLYEIYRGRSGRSEHCYIGKGAVDLTCRPQQLQELFEALQDSAYTRVCLYPNNKFIHCDFKPVENKQVFIDIGNGWERVRPLPK